MLLLRPDASIHGTTTLAECTLSAGAGRAAQLLRAALSTGETALPPLYYLAATPSCWVDCVGSGTAVRFDTSSLLQPAARLALGYGKEAVQAVAQAIAEAAPSEMDTPMLTPMVKRAMSKSIEEKGVIDVKDVAEEVFRSDPEREAIIEQVSRQIQEEQLEPVIPVENKRVVAQLQKVKIKTDNGISITLPRELADDENSFAVVENGDGTISIIINKVQELKTE